MTEPGRSELFEFMARHRYGVVASTHADDSAQSALVGIAVSTGLEIYFDTLGDRPGTCGASRESWPGITWFRVRPRWIRFSDYNRTSDIVRELRL